MPQVRRCLLGCRGHTYKSLFCIPKNEIRRQIWLKLINMEHVTTCNLYLCSRHFSPKMLLNTRLKTHAMPDINLDYVEDNEPCLDDENDSQFECFSAEDDDSPLHVPVQLLSSSEIQKPIKMVVLPKKFKIIPLSNTQNDPLFVPKEELTTDNIIKHQIKVVDGRAVRIVADGKLISKSAMDQTSVQSVAQSQIDTICTDSSHIRTISKQRSKDESRSPKMRAPLAPLEMRLATKYWHITDSDSQALPKLPTLPISPEKSLTIQPSVKKPVEEPVRVKNIHDVDSGWKEKAKELADQTAKVITPTVVELLQSRNQQQYQPLSNETTTVTVEEIIDIEPREFTTSISTHSIDDIDSENSIIITESDDIIIQDNEYPKAPKIKTVIPNLLCDEILPTDDDLLKSTVKKKFHTRIEYDTETIELINEELFDEKMHTPKCFSKISTNSSNILMMGIEDFKNMADETTEYDTMTFISEASQTGSKGKSQCGFIEKSLNNETFSLVCFHCTSEFPLWDWHHFVEHAKTAHIHEIKSQSQNVAILREITMRVPKKQPLKLYPHYASSELDRILTNPNIQYVLVQGAEPDTVAVIPLENLLDEKSLHQNEEPNIEYNTEIDTDTDDNFEKESLSSIDNDDYHGNINVIHIKRTDSARIMQFLNFLREHPLLWLTRRHGPMIYDEETEKFIMKFDKSMTPVNFRNSMDHLRTWYRRFEPATSTVRTNLDNNIQHKQYVELMKEIEELSQTWAFHCEHCTYYFLDEDRLETHKYLKHDVGDLPHACSCGLRFADVNRKNAHEITHKPKPSFMCEMCGMSFLFNRTLVSHMNTKHADVTENPLPFKCNECDARFPNSQTRSWHALKHAPPRFKCDICGQSYLKSFPYKQHMKKHKDQRDFVCEDCGKAFVEKRGLINHRYRVHKAGGYHCYHCDTYYSSYENLFLHNQLRHPDGANTDRPRKRQKQDGVERKRRSCCSLKPRIFKCKQCGTVFDRQYQLMRHKRLLGHHLGERYYKCPHCIVICKSRVALVRHLRSLHNIPIQFSEIKDDDYFVNIDTTKFEESEVNDEAEYAVQTISCTESDSIIVQDEEIEEIFEDFESDPKIQEVT